MDNFSWQPDLGAQTKHAPKVDELNYGDGYSMTRPSGIHNDLKEYSLTFTRDIDTVNDIDDFLIRHRGASAFWFTPNDSGKPVTVRCSDWKRARTRKHDMRTELTATFKEVVV